MSFSSKCLQWVAGLLLLFFCQLHAASDRLDPKLAKSDPDGKTLWYDVSHLDLEGKGWANTESPYDRLPVKAKGIVRGPVWDLSHDSAGLCVRFVTNAPTIQARWTLRTERLAKSYVPASGQSGLDLYVRTQGDQWRWLAVGQPTRFPVSFAKLVQGLSAVQRTYLLYLPLYNGITSVEIGIPRESTIAKATPRDLGKRKPIVFYGTSITQGAYASRPGMVHTAIVGRQLNHPVINLGFAGNGRMDLEMAALLGELEAAVYVVDCLANLTPEEVAERAEPFVKALREVQPTTPIVLVENETYPAFFLVESLNENITKSRAALRNAYDRLVSRGLPNIHYLSGERLLGEDGEATVDGSHPSDLGFMRIASAFREILEPILHGQRK